MVSAGTGAAVQLWQCLAKKRPLGLERRDGESPSSLWCSWMACLGFQQLLWRLSSCLLPVLLQTGGAVVGAQWLLLLWRQEIPLSCHSLASPRPSKPRGWSCVDVLPALPFQSPQGMEQLASDTNLALSVTHHLSGAD